MKKEEITLNKEQWAYIDEYVKNYFEDKQLTTFNEVVASLENCQKSRKESLTEMEIFDLALDLHNEIMDRHYEEYELDRIHHQEQLDDEERLERLVEKTGRVRF